MAKRALIFCSNGFIFSEIYSPIIEEMASSGWKFDILLSNYYLATHTLERVKKLENQGIVNSYKVINAFGPPPFYSVFVHPKNIRAQLKEAKRIDYHLLLVGSDLAIFEKYLIHDAKRKKAKTVIVQTGLAATVLEYYLKSKGLLKSSVPDPGTAQEMNGANKLFRKIKFVPKKIKILWEAFYNPLKNNYVLPFFLARTFFPPKKEDKFLFTSGWSDAVICYDPLEYKAIKELIPGLKKLILTKHPSSEVCECQQDPSIKKPYLYCLMAGPIEKEMDEKTFERWVEVILKTKNIMHLEQIHLRFHPRTDKKLAWPKKLAEILKSKSGCEIKNIDSAVVALPDNMCEYSAAIGAISGSLRVARVSCPKIPVIGMPNISTYYEYGDEYSMGEAQGIVLLKQGEDLTENHLIVNYQPENLPTAAKAIQSIL